MVGTSIAKSIICTEAALQEEEASVSLVAVGSSDTSAESSDAKLTFLNNALTQKENMLKSAYNKIEFLEKKLELRSRQLAEANLSALSDRSAGVQVESLRKICLLKLYWTIRKPSILHHLNHT